MTTWVLDKSSDGNVIQCLFPLTFLTILFTSLISETVAFVILELIVDTWKLISGHVMFESQFNCPRVLRNADHSSSVVSLCGFEICSLFNGMVLILSIYVN